MYFSPQLQSAWQVPLEPRFQLIDPSMKQAFSILKIITLYFNCLHISFHTGLYIWVQELEVWIFLSVHFT